MVAPRDASKFLSAPPNAVRGFLFYGSDSLQILARAEALAALLAKKAGSDTNVIRLHESDAAASPERIVTELRTSLLFGGVKIVWLTSLPAKAHEAVLEAVAKPLEDAFLIAQAPDLKKSHRLVQTFEGAPYLAAISCYDKDRDAVISTIRDQVSSFGCEIDGDAAALVAARCDYSALLARNEAEKLILYVAPARRITSGDVEDCLIDQQTAGLAEIIDHALDGDGRKAILAFERFMAVEGNVTPIFVVLSSTLLRLYALRTAADAGAPVMQAIKDLRPPVFYKQQDALAARVRSWPAQAISAILKELNAILLEARLKAALAEDFAANFILRIARTRRQMR